jgi:hypothetical protein
MVLPLTDKGKIEIKLEQDLVLEIQNVSSCDV